MGITNTIMNINALHILQHPLLAAKAKKEAEEKRLAEKAQKVKESEMKLTYGKNSCRHHEAGG